MAGKALNMCDITISMKFGFPFLYSYQEGDKSVNLYILTMKTTIIILLATLISLGLNTIAQVAINTDGSNPHTSAMLDVKSSTKGVLSPRMTTSQRDAIGSPEPGLFIFNTDGLYMEVYTERGWQSFEKLSCAPGQPAAITGNNIVCASQSRVAYSVAAVSNATSYHWTVPSGAAVASGQGTAGITVDFGSQAGNVSVRAESGCGNSTYEDRSIFLGPPGIPGPPSGPPIVPVFSFQTYSINAVAGATSYHWTVPNGASITMGQGTTSVQVLFGNQSGNVSVSAENNCGNSNYIPFFVMVL